jgi:hypothetical protein
MTTYDIIFSDSENSNSKGFRETFEYCKNYIDMHNGSNHSYFADYKGGTVAIISDDTYEIVYQTTVK